ncbi:MAG: PAS domain S-box protein, partial [Candidatus Hermodarchaeota archaeon]
MNLRIAKESSTLKTFEEKFKFLLENANDLIAILDQDFKYEYVNKQYKRLLGYSIDDLIGKNPICILHPEDIKIAMKTARKGIKIGKASVDLRIRHKKGHYLWFAMKGTYFKDVQGTGKHLLISRNITERKIIEENLRKSEEKFHSLIINISDVIFELDSKNKFTYVSPQVFDMCGYQPEELIGKNVFNYIKPDDISAIASIMKEALNTDRVLTLEGSARHKNGTYIPVSARGRAYRSGEEIKHIVILRDITQSRKAEIELKESEEKYRLISENTDDLIVVYNEKYQIEYLNEETHSRILGYDAKLFKKPNFRTFLVHREDRAEAAPLFKNVFNKGKYKIQFRIKHQNGNYLWFETKGRTYQDKNGRKKLLLVSRDITEIKGVEEKLKELSQIKTELLRRASHEFKTPLVSVYGAAELLLEQYQNNYDKIAKEFIEIIKKGGERLKIIVDNLLDVSQLESGNLKLNKKRENLTEIILECINEVKFFANSRKITIEFNYDTIYYINIDKIRFEQVILNLLSNSIKYTPPNGSISINIEKPSKSIIDISITDTG